MIELQCKVLSLHTFIHSHTLYIHCKNKGSLSIYHGRRYHHCTTRKFYLQPTLRAMLPLFTFTGNAAPFCGLECMCPRAAFKCATVNVPETLHTCIPLDHLWLLLKAFFIHQCRRGSCPAARLVPDSCVKTHHPSSLIKIPHSLHYNMWSVTQ